MRRILLATLAASALILTTSTDSSRVEARQPRGMSSSSNTGFFSRMMELERRKNAWLRSTFTGR